VVSTKLTLADIADLRAYERERDEFRARVIELKKIRRVAVGPVVTLLFESRETIRYQIQEMARAERIFTDQGIQAELDVYNPLIPSPGELSATLFIELTSRAEMEHWLPRLVGIERSLLFRLGQGREAREVRCVPEEGHQAQLTREAVTASVHYVHFRLDPAQVEAFGLGPVVLAADHPSYREETALSGPARASLLEDLRSS
jgi:hypothetical protein